VLFIFLLSLHLFMLIVYMILIETKKSRLTYGHILFALFLPFAGELCLLVSELGKAPAGNNFVNPFIDFCDKVEGKTNSIYYEPAKDLSREQLLSVIEEQPSNLAKILKTCLNSKDIEVAHISAASIMKLQRAYENRIKAASENYRTMPNNMQRLAYYIHVVDEYDRQNLLSGESAIALLEQEEHLLDKYLSFLPKDIEMGILSVNVSLQLQKATDAIRKAELLRYSSINDLRLWKLSIETCTAAGKQEKVKMICEEAHKLYNHWNYEQKRYWSEIEEGLLICVAQKN